MTELTEPEDEYPEAASTYRTTKPEVYLPVRNVQNFTCEKCATTNIVGDIKTASWFAFLFKELLG